MSADNILVIFEHEGKIRVHDVNFSDISSHPSWDYPLTLPAISELSLYIRNGHYAHELHKCDTFDQAVGFCKRYMRTNVVEYDYACLKIVTDKADDSKAVRKMSKEKKRRRQIAKSAKLAH